MSNLCYLQDLKLECLGGGTETIYLCDQCSTKLHDSCGYKKATFDDKYVCYSCLDNSFPTLNKTEFHKLWGVATEIKKKGLTIPKRFTCLVANIIKEMVGYVDEGKFLGWDLGGEFSHDVENWMNDIWKIDTSKSTSLQKNLKEGFTLPEKINIKIIIKKNKRKPIATITFNTPSVLLHTKNYQLFSHTMKQSVLTEIMNNLKEVVEPNLITQIEECNSLIFLKFLRFNHNSKTKYSDAIIYDEKKPEKLFEHMCKRYTNRFTFQGRAGLEKEIFDQDFFFEFIFNISDYLKLIPNEKRMECTPKSTPRVTPSPLRSTPLRSSPRSSRIAKKQSKRWSNSNVNNTIYDTIYDTNDKYFRLTEWDNTLMRYRTNPDNNGDASETSVTLK
eukprot:Pgem_evm1s2580